MVAVPLRKEKVDEAEAHPTDGGFGSGSNLYKPGAPANQVRAVAAAYAAGFAGLRAR